MFRIVPPPRPQVDAVASSLSRDLVAVRDGRPRRAASLLRKYEAAALLPDLSVTFLQQMAPAIPLFEQACSALARGSLLRSPRGPVAIEDLLPGDIIDTSHGPQPVTWIGATSYVPGLTDQTCGLQALLRLTGDALGLGRPAGDLLLGPAARMVVTRPYLRRLIGRDRVLVPVADYADGDRIIEVRPGGAVQLYHLMTPRHGTFSVSGIELETYHPGRAVADLAGHNLRALFLSLFPQLSAVEEFGALSLTRSTREVIDGLVAS